MGLETTTTISGLVVSNPVSGDTKSQGDDHLRLIKTVLQTTFPNANKPLYFPNATTKNTNYQVTAADESLFIAVDSGAGPINITLPTTGLGSLSYWVVHICKFTGDSNPVFVLPPSGTIDGFAKIRLNVPHEVTTFVWLGSFFTRIIPFGQIPAGTHIESASPNVPVGYLPELGQSLTAADYPELFAAIGWTYGGAGANFSLPNAAGLALASVDATSSRLDATNFGGGVTSPATVGNVGGSKSHQLTVAQLAIHQHANTVGAGSHTHTLPNTFDAVATANARTDAVGANFVNAVNTSGTDQVTSGPSAAPTITNVDAGSDAAHPNVQPTMISNRILRAC